MCNLKKNPDAANAIFLGTLCSVAYLAVYFARNILSVVTPEMVESGGFTTEKIGSLSSIYFITYAVGQLINGIIGDKIKAKYMISFGLVLAGVCNILFSLFAVNSWPMAYISYGFTGFFLSMIYAPMTKVVAENTKPIYATRCSLGYDFASLFGSPLAGMVAVVVSWQGAFAASSVSLLAMGAACLLIFTLFEKKKIIQYNKFDYKKEDGGSIKTLIKRQIIKYTLVSVITGVVRTTVVFWLPTYMTQYLKFSAEKSAMLFTVATLVISLSAFISVFVYEKLGYNLDLTVLLSFISATVCFLAVFFIKIPVLNVGFMVLAILSSGCASSMLWSRYCPSLADTGMVSGATGYLDFVSYIAASVSSKIFANSVSSIGWSGLIIVWFALMVAGILVSLPYKKILNKK